VRNVWPKASKTVQWTVLSDERAAGEMSATTTIGPVEGPERSISQQPATYPPQAPLTLANRCRAFPEYVICTKVPHFDPKNIAPGV